MSISAVGARNDEVLKNVATGTQNEMEQFIAGKIFPGIKVNQKTGDILEFGGDHRRVMSTVRQNGDTNFLTVDIDKADAWKLQEHELSAFVSNDIVDQYGRADSESTFTAMLMETLLIARESAAVTATTTTTDYAAANKQDTMAWDDGGVSSTPRADLVDAMEAVKDSCGRYPNRAIISSDTYTHLINHPAIRDAVGNVGESVISKEKLKTILFPHYAPADCEIMIGQTTYNSAKKGQTVVNARVWSKVFVYMYVNPSPAPRVSQSSFGYSFNRGKNAIQVFKWKQPNFRLDEINISDWWEYDDVVISYGCAYLFTNTIS